MLLQVLVVFLEDCPQLVISGIYLNVLGFASADSVAIFSFSMSILSFIINCALLAGGLCGATDDSAEATVGALGIFGGFAASFAV